MMLIESSIPSSIGTAVSSASDHGQQEFTHVWLSDNGAWQEFPKRNMLPQDGYGKVNPFTVRGNKDDNSCSPNLLNCSHLSTVTTMSDSSTNIVYKRRKIQRNPAAVFPTSASTCTRLSDYSPSTCCSDLLSLAVEKPTSNVNPTPRDKHIYDLKVGSIDGHLLGEEPAAEHNAEGDVHKCFGLRGANESCSSSKSDTVRGSASLRPELDDTWECSSSGALIEEAMPENLSEKDLCIALLRTHGLLGGVKPPSTSASAEPTGNQNDRSCSLLCKICFQSEITLKMLICDCCEEAFHLSCCNPRIKKIPVAEWLCHFCLRKKLKRSDTGSSKSLNCDKGKQKSVTSKDDSGPIASMLMDTEPYSSRVRVGKGFQADVPDWSGPKAKEDNYFGKAVELNPLEDGISQGWDSNKPSKVNSIGNWLQCQEVIYGVGEGVDGAICGKWRRAPLYEVQTDNWECFSSVHWDPIHSDCAAPQELDTDEVLKQLKYIEMLRPRLGGKRSNSSVKKRSESQERTQGGRNTQTI